MSKVAYKRSRKRDAALSHACGMIALHGLSGLNMREVAEAAGCSVGTLYNLFGNADGLIMAANSEVMRKLDAVLTEAAGDTSPRRRLINLGKAYLKFVADNGRAWYAVFEHKLPPAQRIPDWHLEEHLALFRHVAGPLSELSPDTSRDEIHLLARSVYSAVHGIVSLGLEDRMSRIPVEVLERHVEIVVGSFVDGFSRNTGSACAR